MVREGCQIRRGVHLFCRSVLFYHVWVIDLSGIRIRNGRRIDRNRGSLRVAFDMARSFPCGEEGRLQAVLMNEDGIKFTQQGHGPPGEGGEGSRAAEPLGEAVVFDGQAGVDLFASGEDLLDEIWFETALEEDGENWLGGLSEGGGVTEEALIAIAARHAKLLPQPGEFIGVQGAGDAIDAAHEGEQLGGVTGTDGGPAAERGVAGALLSGAVVEFCDDGID
jgi:hypothetical protein